MACRLIVHNLFIHNCLVLNERIEYLPKRIKIGKMYNSMVLSMD